MNNIEVQIGPVRVLLRIEKNVVLHIASLAKISAHIAELA